MYLWAYPVVQFCVTADTDQATNSSVRHLRKRGKLGGNTPFTVQARLSMEAKIAVRTCPTCDRAYARLTRIDDAFPHGNDA